MELDLMTMLKEGTKWFGYVIVLGILVAIKLGKVDYFSLNFGKKNKIKKANNPGNPTTYITEKQLEEHCPKEHAPIVEELKNFRKETKGYLVDIANELGVDSTRENPIE